VSIIIHPDPVPLRTDEDGNVCIGKTRVMLDTLIDYFHQGMTPAELAESFPTVGPADVYATLAYYHRHKAEVDEYLRLRSLEAEAQRAKMKNAQPELPADMKARMEAFKAKRDANRASSAQ
jgi:uncharacterized protein (DUF433 family)